LAAIVHAVGVGSAPGPSTPSPATLTAVSGTITPNAALGYGPHRYSATSDVTVAEPTGGVDGELIEVQVYASGADRVLTVAGSAITIPAGLCWWGHLSYDPGHTTWFLDDGIGIGSAASATGSASDTYSPTYAVAY
jgi:hypothetical protein